MTLVLLHTVTVINLNYNAPIKNSHTGLLKTRIKFYGMYLTIKFCYLT